MNNHFESQLVLTFSIGSLEKSLTVLIFLKMPNLTEGKAFGTTELATGWLGCDA